MGEVGSKDMAPAGGEKGWGDGVLFRAARLVSKSDFTNRMYFCVSMRTGRSQRHPCRATPEIAIHGDFPLWFQHSVSEITDFRQSLAALNKTPSAHPFSPPASFHTLNVISPTT